jgi:hypothetical protein
MSVTTIYPDRTLPIELWYRYVAMGGREFNEWFEEFKDKCHYSGGCLKYKTWRVKPNYNHNEQITSVELWKGANDYICSKEEQKELIQLFDNYEKRN